jgi:hypothetical protein
VPQPRGGFYHSKEDFNGDGPVLFLSEQHGKGKNHEQQH